MRGYLVALDTNGNLQIFRGVDTILSVNLASANLEPFCFSGEYGKIKSELENTKAVGLSNGKDWRINVHLADGKAVRICLDVLHKDSLVDSILQAIQSAVPKKLFANFYSDYLEVIQVNMPR